MFFLFFFFFQAEDGIRDRTVTGVQTCALPISVCIANAVADALGTKDVELPIVPAGLAEIVRGAEPIPPVGRRAEAPKTAKSGRQLSGEGSATVNAPPEAVWAMLLDPATLQAVIPGCHGVEKISDTHFHADVTIGI